MQLSWCLHVIQTRRNGNRYRLARPTPDPLSTTFDTLPHGAVARARVQCAVPPLGRHLGTYALSHPESFPTNAHYLVGRRGHSDFLAHEVTRHVN